MTSLITTSLFETVYRNYLDVSAIDENIKSEGSRLIIILIITTIKISEPSSILFLVHTPRASSLKRAIIKIIIII